MPELFHKAVRNLLSSHKEILPVIGTQEYTYCVAIILHFLFKKEKHLKKTIFTISVRRLFKHLVNIHEEMVRETERERE
jgi:hypothetical protein